MKSRLTPDEFLENLKVKNKHYKEGDFNIVSNYETYNEPIVVSNKYGSCLMKPSLLLQGYNLSVRSAIDVHSYFINMALERNTFLKQGDIKVINKFINDSTKLIVETKYGQHSISPYSLFQNNLPNIKTAIDKDSFIRKQFVEIHNELYKYDEFKFISHKQLSFITCPLHGNFEQSPDHHLRGYGCNECANEKRGYKLSNWLKACPNEKGKLYILECYNENEAFIKIGITCQTVEVRYNYKPRMPYSYEVVRVLESYDRKEIWELEKRLKKDLKESGLKYNPKIPFDGSKTETFIKNNEVIKIINEKINSVVWD